MAATWITAIVRVGVRVEDVNNRVLADREYQAVGDLSAAELVQIGFGMNCKTSDARAE
jgi:hypothetical protein